MRRKTRATLAKIEMVNEIADRATRPRRGPQTKRKTFLRPRVFFFRFSIDDSALNYKSIALKSYLLLRLG